MDKEAQLSDAGKRMLYLTFDILHDLTNRDSERDRRVTSRFFKDLEALVSRLETEPPENQKEFFIILRILLSDLENAKTEDKGINIEGLINRVKAILEPQPGTIPLQNELFPTFKPQKSVELKKEFALNFGGLEKIEKEYKHLLKEKLTSGLTLQQHIDKIKNWFNSLRGEDLGNWIKLFAYVKAVKDQAESPQGDITANFRELSPGRYCFSIRQDKDFFIHFIRRDKNSGQYTTKAKNKFLKWLADNKSVIEFPMIINGDVWNIPMRIYEYAENVSTKEIYFVVDTNILESEFRDYVSINIGEIDAISEAWESIANNNAEFSREGLRLNGFVDIPLKFLLTLKNIYSREGDYKSKDGDYTGNAQRLTSESLDKRLGDLTERIKTHLIKINKIRTGKTGKLADTAIGLILEATFNIAKDRGWIVTMPMYENGMYKFNINAGYFDRKHTAKRLNAIENP